MGTVTHYQKCECGAITLCFDDNSQSSMYQETFDKLGIDISEAEELPHSYCCDHCANHWGIDLCECGSGNRVGECECGSDAPMQELGMKHDSFRIMLQNFFKY